MTTGKYFTKNKLIYSQSIRKKPGKTHKAFMSLGVKSTFEPCAERSSWEPRTRNLVPRDKPSVRINQKKENMAWCYPVMKVDMPDRLFSFLLIIMTQPRCDDAATAKMEKMKQRNRNAMVERDEADPVLKLKAENCSKLQRDILSHTGNIPHCSDGSRISLFLKGQINDLSHTLAHWTNSSLKQRSSRNEKW